MTTPKTMASQTSCTIYLLSLHHSTSASAFLDSCRTAFSDDRRDFKPLVAGQPRFWVVNPTSISRQELLAQPWHLALILPTRSGNFPPTEYLKALVSAQVTINSDVPNSFLENFHERNAKLLHKDLAAVAPLPEEWTKSTVPNSAIEDDAESVIGAIHVTRSFADAVNRVGALEHGDGAVSMLNLLSFRGEQGKGKYFSEYVAEFAKNFGEMSGGEAKVLGPVKRMGYTSSAQSASRVDAEKVDFAAEESYQGKGWDDWALIHYDSIWHFTRFLASKEYKAMEAKAKHGTLYDTCILCIQEFD